MKKWSINQIEQQSGRVAVVTGANSGIGYETFLQIAKKNLEVVMACRDLEKAEEAKSTIQEEFPPAQVQTMQLDLSSLKNIRSFAEQYIARYDRLDLLINNAGIMMTPHEETEDGFENQLATNYLGHFALTGLLFPLLASTAGSRVVSVSSLSYKWAEIQFEDIHFRQNYSKRKAYGQSKRACLMFAYELQRRLNKTNTTTFSLAAHPGLSKTNLDRHFPVLIRPLGAFFLQRAEKGALPVLYAALENDLKGGEFIGPDGFRQMRGYPQKVASDAYSRNSNIAKRLWQLSEEMTGVSFLKD